MTARLIKTARSLKVPQKIGQIVYTAALPPPHSYEGMISLVKRSHMMYHVKNYQRCNGEEWTEDFDSRKMEQFVCILILICTGKALGFKLKI